MRAPDFSCRLLRGSYNREFGCPQLFHTMTYLTLHDFSSRPIKAHPFSTQFKIHCANRGYHCLQDIFDLGAEAAIQSEALGINCFKELIDYLEKEMRLFLFVK